MKLNLQTAGGRGLFRSSKPMTKQSQQRDQVADRSSVFNDAPSWHVAGKQYIAAGLSMLLRQWGRHRVVAGSENTVWWRAKKRIEIRNGYISLVLSHEYTQRRSHWDIRTHNYWRSEPFTSSLLGGPTLDTLCADVCVFSVCIVNNKSLFWALPRFWPEREPPAHKHNWYENLHRKQTNRKIWIPRYGTGPIQLRQSWCVGSMRLFSGG